MRGTNAPPQPRGATAVAQEPAAQPAVGRHVAQPLPHALVEYWQSDMQAEGATGCALAAAGAHASPSTARTTSKRRTADLIGRAWLKCELVIETSSSCRRQTNVRE